MNHVILSILFIVFSHVLVGQSTFIKEINNAAFGSALRVVPAENQSWAVYSKDSLKLCKFNSCGDIIWNYRYQIPNETNSLSDFIATQDGGFLILSRAPSDSGNSPSLTKINSAGLITWSYSYAQDGFDYYPYTVTQDIQGNFVVFANLTEVSTNNFFNLIFRVNSSGAIMDVQLYNYGWVWGGSISTSDGGILLRAGNNLIKLNPNLSVQWVSLILSGTYNYFSPIEVSNGYIFSGYSNVGQLITYFKIDFQGNLMWGGGKQSNIVGSPKYLQRKSNGNLASLFLQTNSGVQYTTIAEFDEEMNLINQNSFSNGSLNGLDMCFLTDDIPLVVGTNLGKPFYAKLDQSYLSGCDINQAPITFTVIPISSNSNTILVNAHNLTAISNDFSSSTSTLSTTGICSVTKVLDLGNDTVICGGSTLTLQNQTNDIFDHYNWSTGETTSFITVSEPGRYWLLVYDDCDVNRANDTIWIELLPAIKADLGDDRLVCENETEFLIKPTCIDCQFQWNTGDLTDSISISEAGIYWLEIISANGCQSIDSVEIDFGKCSCDLYLPNAFSPNNDGLNDTFSPKFECNIVDYSMLIFNRWGELIYSSTSSLDSWDGNYNNKRVAVDIYSYRLTYTSAFLNVNQSPIIELGSISIVN